MKNEIWKPIPKYEGYYAISDKGRVKSIARVQTLKDGRVYHRKDHVYSPTPDTAGYLQVTLRRNGKQTSQKVHRMVAAAFLGERPEGMQICHNNGIKTDNRLENLRYDTPQNNCKDQVLHGNHCQARKTHCPRGHTLTPPNLVNPEFQNGRRQCLACKRAHSYLRYRGLPLTAIKPIADEKYNQIMMAHNRAAESEKEPLNEDPEPRAQNQHGFQQDCS